MNDLFEEKSDRKVHMDLKNELNQGVCPLCGFNERANSFKKECTKCGAKETKHFGWYLLKDERKTLTASFVIIGIALGVFVVILILLTIQKADLEKIISEKTLQLLFALIEPEGIW